MFVSEQTRDAVGAMQQHFNALSEGEKQVIAAFLQHALQAASEEAGRRREACHLRPEDLHTPIGPRGTLPVF